MTTTIRRATMLLAIAVMAAGNGGRCAVLGDEVGRRGQGHAQHHDWYRELKQPGTGYSCCNGTVDGVEGDCRPTRAYMGDDGQWHALLDGRWVPVPPRVVLKQQAPDGRNHICAGKSGAIHCFLGGSPKS
jgi:hypothetical protein